MTLGQHAYYGQTGFCSNFDLQLQSRRTHFLLLFRRLTQDGEIKSCLAQKRSSCESKSETCGSERTHYRVPAIEDSHPPRIRDVEVRPTAAVVPEVQICKVGQRQMLLQVGQAVWQGSGRLGRFIRCFQNGSPGDSEEFGGIDTECFGCSASSLGVGGTNTADQGCHLPLRPSSRPDLQASDGHRKGRGHCEEPQGAIVEGAGRTRESARPRVGAPAQTRSGDATQGRGGSMLRSNGSSGWHRLMVGYRVARLGRRRRTCPGVIAAFVAILGWISLSTSAGVAQVARCYRGLVDQDYGDAAVHRQHHHAVQCFPGGGHVGDSDVNTSAEAECVCRWSWICCSCDSESYTAVGTVIPEQEASGRQIGWRRQPSKVYGGCGRRRFADRPATPTFGFAARSRPRLALVTVKQLRLHMGMRHPHDVLHMVGMQQREFDQMHETFLGIPLAADEEQVNCLTIYTDGSASLDAAWPRRRTAAGWGAVLLQGKPGAEQGLIGVVGGQVILHSDHLHFLGANTRTVSTAEITGIAIPAAYLLDLSGLQSISFMVDSRHAVGVLSGQMRALANVELVQNGRALISRLSERTVVQWRHVAAHTGIVYNELADRQGCTSCKSRRSCLSDWSSAETNNSRCESYATSNKG